MAGIDIKLSVSPLYADPRYNFELQSVYNSLHILGAYASILKESVRSPTAANIIDGEDPNISLPFVNSFYAVALQTITPGSIVSPFAGGIVNGVLSSQPVASFNDPAVTVGSTGSRRRAGVVPLEFFVAITAAAYGEKVQVAIGPGITKLTGAKCGQIVWAVDSQSVYTQRRANTVDQIFTQRDLVGNGGLYLANPTGTITVGGGSVTYNWEGYWLQGFPGHSGNQYLYNRVYLYPVGICVKDDFVMFSDYKRSDPLRDQNF